MKIFGWILRFGIFLITLIISVSIVALVQLTASVFDASRAIPLEIAPVEEVTLGTPIPVPEGMPPAPLPIYGPDIRSGSQTDVEQFDPTGNYSIREGAPSPFDDFVYFEIETRLYHDEDGNYREEVIPPRGVVHAKRDLSMSRVAVSGHNISFQTVAINGTSYRFTGRFHDDNYCEMTGSTASLSGRLIKIKNGKWAGEIEAQFYRECGC